MDATLPSHFHPDITLAVPCTHPNELPGHRGIDLHKQAIGSLLFGDDIDDPAFPSGSYLAEWSAQLIRRFHGALQVYPKSHFSILNSQNMEQIRQTKSPLCCEVDAGGIHLMKPWTLHTYSKTVHGQCRRVVHLEFADALLAEGLEWLEKERI